ncbi:MAG: DUF3656 domain-containing protein [Eubacteriales bacterium]
MKRPGIRRRGNRSLQTRASRGSPTTRNPACGVFPQRLYGWIPRRYRRAAVLATAPRRMSRAGRRARLACRAYRNETPLVPVDLHFHVERNRECVRCPATERMQSSEGMALERAIHCALGEENAKKNLEKTGGTPFFVRSFAAEIAEGYTMPASALNAMRREALDELLFADSRSRTSEEYKIAAPERYPSQQEKPALWARFYQKEQIVCADSFEKIILPAERSIQSYQVLGDRLTAQLPTVLFPADEPAFDAKLKCSRKRTYRSLGEQHLRHFAWLGAARPPGVQWWHG